MLDRDAHGQPDQNPTFRRDVRPPGGLVPQKGSIDGNHLQKCKYWGAGASGPPGTALHCAQFDGAEFSDFCDCGCNSFGVRVQAGTPPLARKARHGGVVFTADFALATTGQIEIMLSVDGAGNLDRVDVMCNANSVPIADAALVGPEPFHVSASKNLID